ncbi:hypothetical protein PO909_001021 [Leuciscus waleckii]
MPVQRQVFRTGLSGFIFVPQIKESEIKQAIFTRRSYTKVYTFGFDDPERFQQKMDLLVFMLVSFILLMSHDSHIPTEDIEEVSWKKTDEDEDILVLLYQNNKTLLDSSDEQYRDRVEFFTDEIPKGNFSLRLKSVRTEDKGVYMCQVFAGRVLANATAELKQLGFSILHIIVLIICIAAGSGAVLLFSGLVYCRSKNTVTSSTIWNVQVSLVFYPNICMFFAFIFWGLTEGYLNETITCCALYILRPVMFIWALPYLHYLQDNLKTWTRLASITKKFAVLTAVVYSGG